MTYESINSSPDTVRINGHEIDFNQGKAFSFLGLDNLLWSNSTHNYIINAMKNASSGEISKKKTREELKDYDVKLYGPLTDIAVYQWREMLNTLDYYSLAKIRQKTTSGRIWKNAKIDNTKNTITLISFWTDQEHITAQHLNLICECFKVTDEVLWEGTDSKEFISFTPGQKEEVKAGSVRKLSSKIAPQMSHEELLSILMRAHYDANLSPFERRIARELQGLDPTILKAHTGGYPTAAEYNYRSKFSESFFPLLSESSVFDNLIKKYLNSFDK
jgi:hypothetical protein